MKKRTFICILLFILGLLQFHPSYAQHPYESSWFNVSIDNCTGKLTIYFVIYCGKDGDQDDYFWSDGSKLQMKVGNGTYFDIGQMNKTLLDGATEYTGEGDSNNANKDVLYYKKLSGYSQTIPTDLVQTGTADTDRPFWITVELLLNSSDVGKTIFVKTLGDWEGTGSPSEMTVNFNATPDLSAITVSNKTECGEVKIDWTTPSNLCPGSQVQIIKNSTVITESASDETYSDVNVADNTSYNYRVRFIKMMDGGWNNVGAYSPIEVGEKKTPPLYPSAFEASDENCDQTVDISWDYTAGVDSYKVKRGSTVIATLNQNITSYTDTVPQRGTIYNYNISAHNNCGWGAYSPIETGISPSDPGVPTSLIAEVVPGVGILVSWTDVLLETSYKVERSLLGGGGSTFVTLDANTTSYLDNSVLTCQTYEYRVYSVNKCNQAGIVSDTTVRGKLVPDLSDTFIEDALLASKGFYSNRVELSWSVENNENFLNAYKIYRKELNSEQDSTLITTLNSGSNMYVDNLVDAGTLYEYFIVAESQCESNTVYSNPISAIGFRSPFGNVSGNVSYMGSIAVEDAKIMASTTSQIFGKSLKFNGAGNINIEHQNSQNADQELLLETWIKPATFNTSFALVEKPGSYSLTYDKDSIQFEFEINYNTGLSAKIQMSADSFIVNEYLHLAAQLYEDSLKIFINGQPEVAAYVSPGTLIDNSVTDVTIGNGFKGIIDELRIWTEGKSDELISKDYSRLMIGGEPGLVVYIRMNEGIGEYSYDISKQGSLFNKNHSRLNGDVEWSSIIPTSSQLSASAYTDSLGNYLMTIPYNGIGEAFVLTPIYLSHKFDPSTRVLFIGDGSSIHNNIDFKDISSFSVQGSLFYQSTSCPVKDAFIKIDGEYVIVNGVPAQTDAGGGFNVQVPIGNHVINLEQSGHVYSVGRFPSTGSYNFQADLAGLNFQDSTLVKVVGRVVGGLREAAKIPGLGKSVNNIGVAEIILTSQASGGCSTHTIETDSETGEYTVYVPPMKYIASVRIKNDAGIDFGVLDLVDLSRTTRTTIKYDSIFNSEHEFIQVDSISYNFQLDFIHREKPKIIVKDKDGIHDFIGDTTYTYVNTTTGDSIVRNLRVDPFEWPLFHQGEGDFFYRCMIKVYEEYTNADNAAIDSVPCADGILKFNNELSHLPEVQVKLEDVNSPDELKFLIYTFKPGTPNFLEHGSIAEYSYTNKFELWLETTKGEAIYWKPIPAAKVPLGGDTNFRGILLGGRATGMQYITTGPKVPEYILRDPPGSQSSASRDIGSVKSELRSWKWNLGAAAHTEDNIYLGAKFNIGFGVSTATEIENNVTAGFSAKITGGNSGTEKLNVTNTKRWSTNNTNNQPGAGSDVYVGKAKNVQFGIAEHLTLVPDALSGQVDCLDRSFGGFTFAKKYGLSVVPEGYETHFMYDQNHIINYLIPDLVNLRNTILQSYSKFESHLDTDHEYYGRNNDDPVFGTEVSTTTPGEGEYADFDGLSYRFMPVTLKDSLTGDSIRYINEQIEKWEEAIKLNEWEKANIDNQDIIDSLKNDELKKLYAEYKDAVIAYNILTVANGVGGAVVAYGLIVTPVPGTAFAGYATFAVTTATGIAQAELFEEYERYYLLKERIIDRFKKTEPTNYSISGGTEFSSSMSQESASSYTRSIEYNMSAEFKLEVKGKINNNGVGFEKSLAMNFSSGKDWTEETSENETVSFTLSDSDQGDYFSVDVYPSIMGWGPVFKTRAGGRTSCPHEDKIQTQYYQPGTVISERTLQREKPVISVSPSILTNVPIDAPAVFNLTLGNTTESGDKRYYGVDLALASNPFGALVSIDGFSPSQSIAIPANSSINKVLTIEKGPGPVYDYDSLLILIHSECQFEAGTSNNVDIVDSVYVSAHFIPNCTNVALASPEEQWVLNNSFNDTLPVAINEYDVNFFDLNSLRFDYKSSSQSEWTGLQTFWKDTSGMNDPMLSLIPKSTSYTLYDWGVTEVTDGTYDIRVVSQCEFAEKSSITYKGVIDRINPHPFGSPKPSDGILDPDDQISIKFNEPIDLGSLTTNNFDIRGVLNGTKSDHSTSLSFDGTDDYLEIVSGISLENRDFTIEFSARRMGFGEQTIISQGLDPNENIFIGFNSNNNFVFRINNTEIASSNTFNDNLWHNFAVSYNFQNSSVELFVADESINEIVNVGNIRINNRYSGSGRLFIGKNPSNGSHFFKGNLHDLRIWNTSRSHPAFSALKNQILTGREPGLLYNWRIDEADGSVAIDHVRRRDAAIVGAGWQVDPNGSSVFFNGTDNYLKVSTGDVNITEEMDFTLEFWFNSSQNEASTLFSNGTATDQQADSLYSWNINKDSEGIIHVKNYGFDFLATNQSYFDGGWHHFALVLQRSGNLSVYIDGDVQNSTSAAPFKNLGGSSMCLGARNYTIGVAEFLEDFYAGKIDEFRIWNTARKQEQIKRDKQNRMEGDELALKVYFPFEDYQLDPTGAPILTPSVSEQMNPLHLVSGSLPALDPQTPVIKLQRPVQSLTPIFSVNNDEIILTPNTSPEIIENVILDVSVKWIKDLHGNIMQSPVTWIAYVDKNQVMWDEREIDLEKAVEDPLSFSANILNTGGALKEYTIDNLPEWISVNAEYGEIEPNSSKKVTFTVSPSVNIGTYHQDIYLHTDFNFDEKLTINLNVTKEAPGWTVIPGQYQYTMSIIGTIRINEILSADAEDMVGVFVGDECRGVANLKYIGDYDMHEVYLDIYSNEQTEEYFEFHVWDASTGNEYRRVIAEGLPEAPAEHVNMYEFRSNEVYGSPSSPIDLHAKTNLIQKMPLVKGWNWKSFNLNMDDSISLEQSLDIFSFSEGDVIRSIDCFSQYGNNWIGTLDQLHPENMYMFKILEGDTLVVSGEKVNPLLTPIKILEGWNWIGYTPQTSIPVNNALGGFTPNHGDLIKSQYAFAMYDERMGWIGTLEALKPHEGYKFRYTPAGDNLIEQDLYYPVRGTYMKSQVSEMVDTTDFWQESRQFSSNMPVVATVYDNRGNPIYGDYTLIASVEGETRGIGYLSALNIYSASCYLMMVYGDDFGEQLEFSIQDPDGRKIPVKETVDLDYTQTAGTLETPLELNIEMDLSGIEGVEGSALQDCRIYPNPFDEVFYIELPGVLDETLNLEIVDAFGKIIFLKTYEAGHNKLFKMEMKNLICGVYFIHIKTASSSVTRKVIKL